VCILAGRAALQVTDRSNDRNDAVKWKWQKGALVADADLGTPTVDTDYTLCVYDHTAGVPDLYMRRTIPGGVAAWVAKGPGRGVEYKEKLGANDGFVRVRLTPGENGRAAAQVRLKGLGLALPGPNAGSAYFEQDSHVTVQLINEIGVCWTSEFAEPNAKRNDAAGFEAKVP
jgi:hypothetical protein